MKQAVKKKDEVEKVHRERNRRAQHAFRQRRQAAEEAQRRRIQQLENTIEEMSNVFINFCDEMIGTDEITRQPRLMAQLQHFTAQAFVLARSVSNTNENGAVRETENEQDSRRQKEKYPAEQQNQRIADSSLPRLSSYQRPSFIESANANTSPTFNVDTLDLINVEMGSGLDAITPPIEQAGPQMHQHDLDTISFSLRLVEVTLSQACLYLNGDLYIPAKDLERAFGSSLRLRTRQQLLAYLRWLLGPGKNEMHQATGINWNTTCARGTGDNLGLFWLSPDDGNSERTDDASGHPSNEDLQPEFLTALGVQEQLQSLGAMVLNSDIIELSISGPAFLEAGATNSGPTLGAFPPTRTPDPIGSAALTVWLNTSLLRTNLAYVAMCLEKGPVYPRREVARAVEASVILARGG